MRGKCTDCNEECNVIVMDFGIGGYEYWGARGTDTQLDAVSDCCEAPCVTLKKGTPITLDDIETDNFDPPDDY